MAKTFDFTVTIGVKADSEEIAKFILQEHMRYMTLVHSNHFVDTKLDCVFERTPTNSNGIDSESRHEIARPLDSGGHEH